MGGAIEDAGYILKSNEEFAEPLSSSFTVPLTLANPIGKVIFVFPKSVVPSVESCASEWLVSTTQDPAAIAVEIVLPGTASARIERITNATEVAVYLNIFLLLPVDL